MATQNVLSPEAIEFAQLLERAPADVRAKIDGVLTLVRMLGTALPDERHRFDEELKSLEAFRGEKNWVVARAAWRVALGMGEDQDVGDAILHFLNGEVARAFAWSTHHGH